jgi:hypothetical protein
MGRSLWSRGNGSVQNASSTDCGNSHHCDMPNHAGVDIPRAGSRSLSLPIHWRVSRSAPNRPFAARSGSWSRTTTIRCRSKANKAHPDLFPARRRKEECVPCSVRRNRRTQGTGCHLASQPRRYHPRQDQHGRTGCERVIYGSAEPDGLTRTRERTSPPVSAPVAAKPSIRTRTSRRP